MAPTKQTARKSSKRYIRGKRARRGGAKTVNSDFCHPPKKGVLLNFKFKLPSSQDDPDYSQYSYCSSNDGSDSDERSNLKKYSVGDDDIVFDIRVITTERKLNIELISLSQKHSVVHLVQCQAKADLLAMDDFYRGDPMDPLIFEPMTFNSQKKSVRVSEYWPGVEQWGREGSGLRINFDDEIFYPAITISGSILYEDPPLKMQQEISTLFNNDEHSDVKICVGEEKNKFPAHKCILSARSSFFQAMFTSNMRETVENVVNLPEESPEVFEQALHYIYNDTCPKISKITADLLIFADKYDVKGLLELCEDEIKKTMNMENVCDYLVKSGMINAKGVYDKCYSFIRKNTVRVTKTAGWAKLKEISEEQDHKFLEDIIKEIEK